MKWFRSNIRHGSRLALLALAIQLVLSFGHFHGVAAEAATAFSPAAHQTSAADPRPQPASHHDSDDVCAICAVMAMANTVLFASPPILPVPQATEIVAPIPDAEFVDLNSARVAFQPRAPPVS